MFNVFLSFGQYIAIPNIWTRNDHQSKDVNGSVAGASASKGQHGGCNVKGIRHLEFSRRLLKNGHNKKGRRQTERVGLEQADVQGKT